MMPPVKLIERGRLRARRLAADPEHDAPAADRRARPARLHRLERGRAAAAARARRQLRRSTRSQPAMEELIRYSERRMRERLRSLPDGVFRTRGFLDHDGDANRVYRVDVRLEKRGDTLRFDIASRRRRRPDYINCIEGALVGGGLRRHRADPRRRDPLEPRDPERDRGDRAARADRQRAAAGGDRRGDDRGRLDDHERRHAVSKLLAFSDDCAATRAAVTHGTFAALFGGDRNQHGEPYGTQLIDAQIGGGGACAVADGIDQSGALGRAAAAHRQRRDQRAARADAVSVPLLLPGHRRRRHVPRRPRGRHRLDAARRRAAAQLADRATVSRCRSRSGSSAAGRGSRTGTASPGGRASSRCCGTATCPRTSRGSRTCSRRWTSSCSCPATSSSTRGRAAAATATRATAGDPSGPRSGSTATRSRAVAGRSSARGRSAGAPARAPAGSNTSACTSGSSLVEYACPSCGMRHAVDVRERDAEPVEDMVLA